MTRKQFHAANEVTDDNVSNVDHSVDLVRSVRLPPVIWRRRLELVPIWRHDTFGARPNPSEFLPRAHSAYGTIPLTSSPPSFLPDFGFARPAPSLHVFEYSLVRQLCTYSNIRWCVNFARSLPCLRPSVRSIVYMHVGGHYRCKRDSLVSSLVRIPVRFFIESRERYESTFSSLP